MIKDGTKVTYGGGATVYRAYHSTGQYYFNTKYTLVAEITGRKRYRVPEAKLRLYSDTRVSPVQTSRGSVSRPSYYRRLPVFSGNNRHTHIGTHWVYKTPRGEYGEFRNQIEACLYQIQSGKITSEEAVQRFGAKVAREAEYYSDVPIAECHLMEDNTLVMERVMPVNNLNSRQGADEMTPEERRKRGFRRPDWSDRVDCEQIGYTRDDKLVAYDL